MPIHQPHLYSLKKLEARNMWTIHATLDLKRNAELSAPEKLAPSIIFILIECPLKTEPACKISGLYDHLHNVCHNAPS